MSLLSHAFAVGLLIAIPILAPSMLPEVWSGDVVADMTDILPPSPPPPLASRRDVTEQPPVSRNLFPVEAPTVGARREASVRASVRVSRETNGA
ncbi:MAG: hypothetical protein Q7R30_13310 [Acidobacteriota bacterium]|nr:hypothetical protein [Acidobacteriota bacterium]